MTGFPYLAVGGGGGAGRLFGDPQTSSLFFFEGGGVELGAKVCCHDGIYGRGCMDRCRRVGALGAGRGWTGMDGRE